MTRSIRFILYSLIPLMHLTGAEALAEDRVLKEDKTHVRVWNRFADQALELHKQLIRDLPHKVSRRTGGYAHTPDFFTEETYTHAKTGRLISRVQWEKRNPSNLHSIEVYVRDDRGRVVRDYVAAYLPGGRNAPVQTLINLHSYNKGLHAFRQFDASSDVIYEYCEGLFQGKKRRLRLFEDDIANTDRDARELLESPLYRSCFAGLPTRPGRFIKPQ